MAQVETNLLLKADAVEEGAVYFVYEDYLSSAKDVARHLRAHVKRGPYARPKLDLPDIFYVLGMPVFLSAFLSVIATMLKEMPDTTDTT
ncbi:hypothetical protein SCARR_03154 [Pontiella sulfatireligans]|uniref:Uncharacterized protein n=2 Tax=Pontiella sulfatireligans TaxID=2750658 RepID=A0A6C2ULG2_9BACT|nr:hypothetical protein SCARR_03154 [Pontiella sulfatireligans]